MKIIKNITVLYFDRRNCHGHIYKWDKDQKYPNNCNVTIECSDTVIGSAFNFKNVNQRLVCDITFKEGLEGFIKFLEEGAQIARCSVYAKVNKNNEINEFSINKVAILLKEDDLWQ